MVIGIALLPSTGVLEKGVASVGGCCEFATGKSAIPKMRFRDRGALARSLRAWSIGFLLLVFFYVFAVMATEAILVAIRN